MKINLLLLVFCFFVTYTLLSQNCIPIAIVFSTQSEVDNFPTNYPGCTTIDGNVGITGNNIT
ncbi:MAG: hypothetical protein WAT79_10870, partial [Saprospiraceae bacterium]